MPNNASHGSVNVEFMANDREVVRLLERFDLILDPLRIGAWLETTVDPWFRQRASDRFQSEGDDVSGPWMALKPATWNYRQNDPQGPFPPEHPINVRTGKLGVFVTQSKSDINVHTQGATLTMPGTKPTGELKKKVQTAQGGRAVPRTVPRPVIGMNERDLLAVLTDLSLYVSVGQFIP